MFVLVLFFSSVSFPPPGDLPYPGIKLTPLVYPALAGSFFTTGAAREALVFGQSLLHWRLPPISLGLATVLPFDSMLLPPTAIYV